MIEIAPFILSAEVSRLGQQVRDAVDGGTTRETFAAVARAGAIIAVVGSAVVSPEPPVSMNLNHSKQLPRDDLGQPRTKRQGEPQWPYPRSPVNRPRLSY